MREVTDNGALLVGSLAGADRPNVREMATKSELKQKGIVNNA